MREQPARRSYDAGPWAALSARLSPLLDPVIGVVAAAFAVGSLLVTDPASIDPRLNAPNAWAVVLTATTALSLGWRRRHPLASYAAFVSGALLVSATGYYIGLLSVFLLLSLYSLAAHGRRRDGLVGLAVGVLVFTGLAVADVPDLGRADLAQAIALLVAAWALGDAIRSRRAEQAERLRAAQQEAATAREQTGRAVVEERLRIARELHDVIAHSMSLIAVQAGVGAHLIHQDVAAAERTLDVIADTSRQALDQTRAMLGLLRQEGDPSSRPAQQGPGDLEALAQGLRDVGLEVHLTVDGVAPVLQPTTELAVYRIVQESLTNILKHSTATTAEVRVGYAAGQVNVDIEDHGVASTTGPRSPGHGLLGLKERATIAGGTLVHEVLVPGFLVRAQLPVMPPGVESPGSSQ